MVPPIRYSITDQLISTVTISGFGDGIHTLTRACESPLLAHVAPTILSPDTAVRSSA